MPQHRRCWRFEICTAGLTCEATGGGDGGLRRRGCLAVRGQLYRGIRAPRRSQRFLVELQERTGRFGPALHPEKTRPLGSGRLLTEQRRRVGRQARDDRFLGFTHICARTVRGLFTHERMTSRSRIERRITAIGVEPGRRMHATVPEVGRWLGAVVRGRNRYCGVSGTSARLRRCRIA